MKMFLILRTLKGPGWSSGLAGAALAALLGASAAAKSPQSLSESTVSRLNAVQGSVAATRYGRRIIVLARGVPRRPASLAEAPFRYIPGDEPFLAVDPGKLAAASDWEVELAFVRELARAGFALPVEMPEIEMAAYQIEMRHALLKAESDSAFARRLRKMFRRHGRDGKRLKAYLRLKTRMGKDASVRDVRTPAGEMERLSYYLYLFFEDPDDFYWAVDRGLSYGPGAVRLTELKDFMDRCGPALRGIRVSPEALYVKVKGRRYPAALARAALTMGEYGGVERLDEVLGDLGVLTPKSLLKDIKRFASVRE